MILVVLYHAGFGASGGYVGVDVFFVISGFLITGLLLRELRSRRRISLLGFYARRARRILPAATLVIVVTTVVSRIVLAPQAAQRALGDAAAAVFYGANFRFAVEGADYFNSTLPPSPLQHFWSLAVEEQFYLLWPILLIASSLVSVNWRRRGGSGAWPGDGNGGRRQPATALVAGVLAALAVMSFVISLLQTGTSPSWAYYSILTRGWELAAGSLAALAVPLAARLRPSIASALTWLGLGAIALSSTVLDSSTAYPGGAAAAPVLGALAVVLGGCASSRLGASVLLGTMPFQKVGDWSYSWYLWHWPVLVLAPSIVGHLLSGVEEIALVAISFALAVLSFFVVEQPLRRMQLVIRRPRLALGGAAALASTSLVVVGLATFSLPALTGSGAAVLPSLGAGGTLTAAQLSRDLQAGAETLAVPSNLEPALSTAANSLPLIVQNGCHLQRAGTASKPCVFGDAGSKTIVVLFGDSHAAAWFPALERIATEEAWRLVDLTKAGCPPVEVNLVNYPQCSTWRENAMRQIAELHPSLVVASWARYVEEPESEPLAGVPEGAGSTWADGVRAIFAFLDRHSAKTLFISDTPTMSQLAPDCVSGHLSDASACTTPRNAATLVAPVKAKEISLAEEEHVDVLDPIDWFCTSKGCPVIVGNILLYRDNAHMTPAYSDFIAPVLAANVVPLLSPSAGGA